MRLGPESLLAIIATACGCGRIAFEPSGDAGGRDHDASGPDVTAAPVCDAFADAIWCNDFETGDLFGAGNRNNGVFVPGGGYAGTGGFSVTSAPGDNERLRIELPSIVTSGSLHVAGRMLFDAATAPVSYVVLAQALSVSFTTKISFDLNATDRLQLVNTIAGGAIQEAAGSFPRQRWFCFELAIVVADTGGGGRVDLIVDDVAALNGWNGETTVPSDGFFAIEVGAISSGSNLAPVTIRLDNLIVRESPVGCP